MTIDRIINLLEIEHQCMLRKSHNGCDNKCEECDLVQDDMELHEMYTNAIFLLKDNEPIKPIKSCGGVYYCGNCKRTCVGYTSKITEEIQRIENYCHNCGKAVKWE